jgi:hypothetical protein
MGGGKSDAEKQQEQLTQQKMQQDQQLYDWSKARTDKMDALMSPAISFAQAIASGDPTKTMQAAAVPLGNIASGFKATKENIYDTIPSGAARDFALAGAERDKQSQTASTLNQSFLQSLNTLFNAGGQQGQFGLQQLGAGLRAGESAMQGNQSLMQADAQRKATTMGFLGSLAGTAGKVGTAFIP